MQSTANNPTKLERVLQKLSKRPAQAVLYGAVILGIASIGGVALPPALLVIAGTMGGNLISNMLERVATKKTLNDKDFAELQNGISKEDFEEIQTNLKLIDNLLTEDQFNRHIFQLVRHIDLQHREILEAFKETASSEQALEIIKRLIRIEAKLDNQTHSPQLLTCNFVPRLDHFTGRDEELASLASQLSDTNSVAITAMKGIGGIGKSTLVRAFATRYDKHFKLKLWAEIGQTASEDLVLRILTGWTGMTFPATWTLEQSIATSRQIMTERLRTCSEPAILIIDDVWMQTVKLARQLREAVPLNTYILITTRSEDVSAKLEARSITLNAMPPDQGANLIIELIGNKAEQLRLELEKLSVELEGHPLALSLAARQLRRNFQPTSARKLIDKIIEGVKRGEDFKTLKLDMGDNKVDSVSATLKLTLDALGGGDETLRQQRQAQFRALGVFPLDLPFQDEQVQLLCNLSEDEAQRLLDDFVAEGLVTAIADREGWYVQHRLLRAYALALLRQHQELLNAEWQYQNPLIHFANHMFSQPQEDWQYIDDYLPQIYALGRQLVAELTKTDDPNVQDELLERMSDKSFVFDPPLDYHFLRTCEDFSAALSYYITGRYIGVEGKRWLLMGLTVARADEATSSIRLFTGMLGLWHDIHGNKQTALAYHQESLHAAQETGNTQSAAITLSDIGGIWNDLGEPELAFECLAEALSILHDMGDKKHEGSTISQFGTLWYDLKEYDDAFSCFNEALSLHRETGDRQRTALALGNVGKVFHQLGDLGKAIEHYQEALSIFQATGDLRSVATCYNQIGLLHGLNNDLDQELFFLERARGISQTIYDLAGEAVILRSIALIHWRQGKRKQALIEMRTALDIKLRIGLGSYDEEYLINLWTTQLE